MILDSYSNFHLLPSIFLFILGASIGSFLNVLSDRLPHDRSINGRSHCDYCKKTLGALDLIPIFSFLFLKARCRYCKKKLSWWYWVAEVGTGAAFVSIWYFVPSTLYPFLQTYTSIQSVFTYQVLSTMYYILLISTLIAIFLSDIKYHIIPDQFVIFLTFVSIPFIILHPLDSLLGVLVVAGTILLFFVGTKGRGMGFGDVKFAIPMGLILGGKGGFLGLYLAFMFGGLVGVILLVFKLKKIKSQIAFGPFLIIGMIIMMFWGEVILTLFDSIFSF